MTHGSSGSRAQLGVVIPTLNEAEALPLLLADVDELPLGVEVVVADGGSRDRTLHLARARGLHTVTSRRGRASQMNAGARQLDTPWILLLHADSRIPPETGRALARWLEGPPPCEAAHFSFRLDVDRPWCALIERGQRMRERLTGLAYGDQGLLLSRRRFEEVGEIPEIPVMEDVEVIRRLRKIGKVGRIDAPIVTSARRYLEEGPFIAWFRHVILLLLYTAGVSPFRLARWYPARDPNRTRSRDVKALRRWTRTHADP